MIYHLTDRILAEKKIQNAKIFRDIDGPGMGNYSFVVREERPKEGGILIWLYGYKYPWKGSPLDNTVWKLHDSVKRLMKDSLGALEKYFKKRSIKIFLVLLFLLPNFVKKDILGLIIESFYKFSEASLWYDFLKPERYSRSVKELYRAFNKIFEQEKDDFEKIILLCLRDIFCMLIEHDSAWRFRFQDIAGEVNKEKLLAGKKEMIAEIKRLFDLLYSREKEKGVRPIIEREKRFEKLILVALTWFKPFRKLVEKIIRELNFDELKLDEADRYFTLMRKDYEFFGIPLPERIKEREKIEGDNWYLFKDLGEAFLKEYNL